MPVTRRNLLIGGGAGVGLLVAWAVWPRRYPVTLVAGPGEAVLGAFVKVGGDGQVTVAVPQTEHGQGVYTALAQIVADELGADWRTVGVEASPLGPAYANPLAADALFGDAFEPVPAAMRDEHLTRAATMLTAGSTSVRAFEVPLRQAGAAARILLCRAAARRWDADWRLCDTAAGFVTLEGRRMRFAEVAAAAVDEALPEGDLPLRAGTERRLTGRALPRLDAPAKVDGSVDFAADVRLPGMVYAAIRQGPPGSRLAHVDRAAAARVRGVVSLVETARWAAAVAHDGWAALRAVDAMAPRFAGGQVAGDPAQALTDALRRPGRRVVTIGDTASAAALRRVQAEYGAAPVLHPAVEPPAATAQWLAGRLELWLATDAPVAARAAAAAAIGVAPDAVTVHRVQVGGSFGAALESDVAAQAAVLALRLERPVQLLWSRRETLRHDRPRAPARARMTAALDASGIIRSWHARIAAPATGAELAHRLLPGDALLAAAASLGRRADGYAVAGAVPPYRLPAVAIDYHPARVGFETGHLRGGAHGYTTFFTECFVDEIAHRLGAEPMSYRVGMLAGDGEAVRLARCLTAAAALGGWEGGGAGSGQGIACHRMAGSHIAVMVEAEQAGGRVRVTRIAAAADVGRAINPELVRQQIEGGLIFGVAVATGCAAGAVRYGDLMLPTLATAPDIALEFIASETDPGGVADLGVGVVAPAIANALRTRAGTPARHLPLQAHT